MRLTSPAEATKKSEQIIWIYNRNRSLCSFETKTLEYAHNLSYKFKKLRKKLLQKQQKIMNKKSIALCSSTKLWQILKPL